MMPLADTNFTQYIVYAMATLAMIYLIMRPMMRRKREPSDPPFNVSLSQQRQVEREMNNVLVELSQMAREITSQLDTRSAKLQALIDDADARIAELKRLSERRGRGRAKKNGSETDPVESDGGQAPSAQEDPRHAEVYSLADAGLPPLEIARRLNRPRGEIELILALRPR